MPYKDPKKRKAWFKDYMKEYRQMEREAIRRARLMGFDTRVKRTQKKHKKKRKKK